MKENKDANANNNTTNTVVTKRNSDIISIERTNNMNNIDLNTITVAEAKAAGITGMDMFTVVRNPINQKQMQKNEEFALELKAKTEKKKPVRRKRIGKKNTKTLGKNLNWQDGDKITKLFSNVSNLLSCKIEAFKEHADLNEAVGMSMHEVFSAEALKDHSDEHLIERGKHQILLAVRAIKFINEDNEDSAYNLNGNDIGSFWHNNFHVVDAAGKAGLISEEEHNNYLAYLESVRFA
jgi:hypothetical protein